jgi:hypothetical protein
LDFEEKQQKEKDTQRREVEKEQRESANCMKRKEKAHMQARNNASRHDLVVDLCGAGGKAGAHPLLAVAHVHVARILYIIEAIK